MLEHNGQLNLLVTVLTGPIFVLLFTGSMALAILVSSIANRSGTLITIIDRSAEKIVERPWMSLLWGMAVTVLLLAFAALCFNRGHILGLVGVTILALLFMFTGIGFAARALSFGRSIAPTEDFGTADVVRPIAIGIFLMSATASIPVLGWFVTVLCVITGIGAVALAISEH